MSSLSYTSTPTYDVNDELNEEMEIFGREMKRNNWRMRRRWSELTVYRKKPNIYVPPALARKPSWSGRTETESVSIADVKSQSQTGSSQPTETTVRSRQTAFHRNSRSFPSGRGQTWYRVPDTARYGFHLTLTAGPFWLFCGRGGGVESTPPPCWDLGRRSRNHMKIGTYVTCGVIYQTI